MSVSHPAPGQELDRDAALLAAQLDLLSGVVAGSALGEALDALLRVVEKVSTGGLLASVLLLDDDGEHLYHGAAPSLPAFYCEAIDGVAIGPSVGSCGTAAFRRSQVIVEDIAHDPLWADYRQVALPAGLRACWSTPVFGVRGRLLGTFAMYYPEPSLPTPGDRALIDVLVRSVSLAIERSRLDDLRKRELAAERTLAMALQRSLLPEVPARIGSVALAARYRTGDPGVHVGGDWFDAMEVDGGLVLVVGDVQGHDVQAATLMGELRTVARAAAFEGHPPAGVLARAADYLDRLGSDLLATALVVHVDVDARLLTSACAGHLPPLVLATTPEGSAVSHLAVETGPPLGIGRVWEERSTLLPDDTVLLLYTDGLVEARSWDIDEGIARLERLLEALPSSAAPSEVLDAALEVIPAGQRWDDVAVLVARLPAPLGARLSEVRRRLPAQPMSVPLARWWAQSWLQASGASPELVGSAAHVLSELMSNAVRQGDSPIRVRLALDEAGLLVEVSDEGHRMPHAGTPGDDATDGRGLRLVSALSEQWGVREEQVGKTVWARLVP